MERKHLWQWSYRNICCSYYYLCCLLLLVSLFACSSEKEENQEVEKSEPVNDFTPKVTEALNSINAYSEKARKIYRESIDLLNNDLDSDSVKVLFQDTIQELRDRINNQLNTVNKLYEQQEISDNEFKRFREQLHFNEIQQLSKKLDSLGVKY